MTKQDAMTKLTSLILQLKPRALPNKSFKDSVKELADSLEDNIITFSQEEIELCIQEARQYWLLLVGGLTQYNDYRVKKTETAND